MSDYAIKATNLHKNFRLPHDKQTTFKQTMLNWHRRSYEELKALNGVDLEVEKGEFFGILGRNGSGKSTLLKTIAGIYHPDQGEIDVRGRLTPFIELGVGFDPELTGKDNVFLNGAILGLSRSEVEDKYHEIVEFAELGRFMDQKLINYSSGMQVRLAFAIAMQAHNEILLIDEVLAVGDTEFQQKCFNHFRTLKKENKTVLFVSHDMSSVEKFCDRTMVLEEGRVYFSGATNQGVNAYQRLNAQRLARQEDTESLENSKRWGDGRADIEDIYTVNNGEKTTIFDAKDAIEINLSFSAVKHIEPPRVGIIIRDAEGRVVFATNTEVKNIEMDDIKKGQKVLVTFTIKNVYTEGKYSISAAVNNKASNNPYARVEEAHAFQVVNRQMSHSLVHPEHSISIEYN